MSKICFFTKASTCFFPDVMFKIAEILSTFIDTEVEAAKIYK